MMLKEMELIYRSQVLESLFRSDDHDVRSEDERAVSACHLAQPSQ